MSAVVPQARGPAGLRRLADYADYLIRDHALLRLVLPNAHRISEECFRSGQPWGFQLRRWRARGVRSVVSLRGSGACSFQRLEREACARLGLTLHELEMSAVHAPTAHQIMTAASLFETLEYPVLFHCKSGADRAGLMAVLYSHFRLGEPIALARRHLSLRYGHARWGRAGVLDFVLDSYLAGAAGRGETFSQWVTGPDYDPQRLQSRFRPSAQRTS